MVEIAEQAQAGLSRFAGRAVAYDATVLQLLDEWIDHHMRLFPCPSQKMRLYWTSLLGEVFRRRHEGEWVIQEQDDGTRKLGVLCPVASGGFHVVEVSDQINRRIANGISASLAYFYTTKSIELRMN